MFWGVQDDALVLPRWECVCPLALCVALSFKIEVLNTLLNWIQESGLLFLHILNVWPCVYQFLRQCCKVSTTWHVEVQKIRMEWLGAAYSRVHSGNMRVETVLLVTPAVYTPEGSSSQSPSSLKPV